MHTVPRVVAFDADTVFVIMIVVAVAVVACVVCISVSGYTAMDCTMLVAVPAPRLAFCGATTRTIAAMQRCLQLLASGMRRTVRHMAAVVMIIIILAIMVVLVLATIVVTGLAVVAAAAPVNGAQRVRVAWAQRR